LIFDLDPGENVPWTAVIEAANDVRDRLLALEINESRATMKIGLNIAAAVLVLIGLVWSLQGLNLLAGSFMSGKFEWLIIGIIVAIAGVALYWINVRRRHNR
jgi:4-hydroxybenzoate polyprenyltransferase